MKSETKIALAIAGAGFSIPLAISAFYAISHIVIGGWILLVCLPCLGFMALDSADLETSVFGLLVIGILNAFVYLLVAGLLRALFGLFKPRDSV